MYVRITVCVTLILAVCISSLYLCFTYLLKSETLCKNVDGTFSGTGNGHGLELHKQPHVVFILADDLGFNDVSYNGKEHGSVISTPNIDRLAAEGVTLGNYYVQRMCVPTRAQLMTGRHPIRYGLQHVVLNTNEPCCLPVDEVTLADKLKEAGYATHAVGKWHLGYYKRECLPTERGFDSFFGDYAGVGYHYNHTTPVNGGFDLHRDIGKISKAVWRQRGQYSTSMFTREAQRVIRRHKKSKQPLFLYLSFLAVHDPYEVPELYRKPYKHLISNKDREILAGMISCVDEGVGNVTETLKDVGLYDNTVIIFSTDNGGAQLFGFSNSTIPQGNNWPLRGCKFTLYEGGVHGVGFVHSPLLPNNVRGTTSQAFMDASDWFPTIVSSLAGGSLEGTKPLDGFDVWDSIV